MIIAGFSGIGKTTLAKLYPNDVIDFVCMPYKYYLDEDEEHSEADKADPSNIMRWEWPENYVKAIIENLSSNKILLIPSDYLVLSMLAKERIKYTLCYPKRKAKKIYHKRFIKRGNSKYFIDIFIGKWDGFMDSLENNSYGHHIVLKPNQYLSDVIDVTSLLKEKD